MKRFVCAVAAALTLGAATAAHAQAWPTKQVRVVVAYPAGGGVDFVARTVAQRLSEELKQSVVVDNRVGASGVVGTDSVIKSDPDGHTILIASPAEVLVGAISGQSAPYDAARDLAPVMLIGETPLVLVTYPGYPAGALAEAIALAKKEPGKHAYGSPGNGSTMHFAGESLNAQAGIDLLHIPYKGAAPAINDLLGGQVPMAIVGMPPVVPHAKAGKLRVLAVTSEKRSSTMPDVPAIAELPGFKGYRFTNWMGVYVPAKTPPQVIERLASTLGKIVREPAIRQRLLSQGVEPIGNSTTEFAAFLDAERATYGRIARERGIRVEP